MKIGMILSVLFLSGCAIIFPKPHDPVMFGNLVEVKVLVDSLECGNPIGWTETDNKITKLQLYSEWRGDPQAPSLKNLKEALKKASESKNKTFCESVLKLNKTRIEVIADAWKGRK